MARKPTPPRVLPVCALRKARVSIGQAAYHDEEAGRGTPRYDLEGRNRIKQMCLECPNPECLMGSRIE